MHDIPKGLDRRTCIDINSLKERHAEILVDGSGLRLGGLARMADVADHPADRRG